MAAPTTQQFHQPRQNFVNPSFRPQQFDGLSWAPRFRPRGYSGQVHRGPGGYEQAGFKPWVQHRPGYTPSLTNGKQAKKSSHRKTVDYNATVLKTLQNRAWLRDGDDQPFTIPDCSYINEITTPSDMYYNPINCVTTKFIRQSTNKIRCPIFCVVWTPEGRRLVTGASSGEFTLWNGLTFNFETILQAHDAAVRTMVWSHDDQWMLTADHTGFVKYWQSNMNNVKMFQAHKEAIRGLSFSPTDSKFVSCSDDGTVKMFDFQSCVEEQTFKGHGADVKCVDWHPHKSIIASGSKDSQQPIKLWDSRTGQSLATIHAHKNTVMSMKWNRNGNWFITASRDHLLKIFDLRNMKSDFQTFKGHQKEATTVAWHPIYEDFFTSGGSDGAVKFWSVGTDKEVGSNDNAHEGFVWSMAWHPMGHILATGSNDHSTKFWARNKPGDNMKDKYNLNLLPIDSEDQDDSSGVLDTTSSTVIPGMGIDEEQMEHLRQANSEGIPGLDFGSDNISSERFIQEKKKGRYSYSKKIDSSFAAAWEGKTTSNASQNSSSSNLVEESGDGDEASPRRNESNPSMSQRSDRPNNNWNGPRMNNNMLNNQGNNNNNANMRGLIPRLPIPGLNMNNIRPMNNMQRGPLNMTGGNWNTSHNGPRMNGPPMRQWNNNQGPRWRGPDMRGAGPRGPNPRGPNPRGPGGPMRGPNSNRFQFKPY